MILGVDKKKLSKRNGDVSTNYYRDEGYLPEALLNFLVRLGWSHGDQELFTVEQMIEFFDFDHVQKSAAVFNLEKLQWINAQTLRGVPPKRLAEILGNDFKSVFRDEIQVKRIQTAIGESLIAQIQPKVKVVKEIADQLVALVTDGVVEVDPSGLKWNKQPQLKAPTQAAAQEVLEHYSKVIAGVSQKMRLGADASWGSTPSLSDAGVDAQSVDQFLRQVSEKRGIKLGELAEPMRLCVTGRLVSAGLFELMVILPWDILEPRLKKVASL
jgi:glutamyl-tRNA synthetase